MAQADRQPNDFEQDVEDLIEESDRQLRQSRELLAHLDRALARSERLLMRPGPAEVDLTETPGEAAEEQASGQDSRYHGAGGGVAAG